MFWRNGERAEKMPSDDQQRINTYIFNNGIKKLKKCDDVQLEILRIIGKDKEMLPQNESQWRDYADNLWEYILNMEEDNGK
jgi:hypothetical protein